VRFDDVSVGALAASSSSNGGCGSQLGSRRTAAVALAPRRARGGVEGVEGVEGTGGLLGAGDVASTACAVVLIACLRATSSRTAPTAIRPAGSRQDQRR
jgi:hypothetical protein